MTFYQNYFDRINILHWFELCFSNSFCGLQYIEYDFGFSLLLPD